MAATVLPYNQTLTGGSDQRALAVLTNTLTRLANNRPTTAAAAIGIGTTTTKVRTNGTCPFMVDGVFASLASTDDFWTLSGTASAASQTAIFLLFSTAAGTASVVQVGPYSAYQGLTAEEMCIQNLPALTDGAALLGSLRIVTSSSQTFTPGTSVPGTGNTATYYDGGYAGYNRLLGGITGTAVEGVMAQVNQF